MAGCQLQRVVFALAGLLLARADLPIHCIHDQIFGQWKLKFSKLYDSPHMCGYKSPDHSAFHFKGYTFKPEYVSEEVMTVSPPRGSEPVRNMGGFVADMNWTLVYDEGMHFSTPAGKNAFAFFEYQPKSGRTYGSQEVSSFVSNCHKTMVGWYHQTVNGKTFHGCFKAEMVAPKKASASPKALMAADAYDVSPTSFVNVRQTVDDDTENFAFNISFIDRVNSDPSYTWKAHPHPALHKSISKNQAYRMLGVSKYRRPSHGWDRRTYFHRQKALRKTPAMMSFLESASVKGLPRSFDWRQHLKDIATIDQGSCGSCYSVSSTMMASIRRQIAIAKKSGRSFEFLSGDEEESFLVSEEENLSSQDVLNCSPENQGCEGGYPFLVGMHAFKRGISHKIDDPYLGVDLESGCSTDRNRFRATGYGYIGGHYGGGNDEALMLDIMHHGPATVGIDTPTSLFSYRCGVFQCKETRHEGTNLKNLKSWEATNHAVLVYGWSETESGQKYWILKNSWGSYWGMGGFFYLQRGSGVNADACAITSMPVGVYYD
ncbi:hypothetical protein AAMO2058_001279600 [Amorphochlora amoebiformis]